MKRSDLNRTQPLRGFVHAFQEYTSCPKYGQVGHYVARSAGKTTGQFGRSGQEDQKHQQLSSEDCTVLTAPGMATPFLCQSLLLTLKRAAELKKKEKIQGITRELVSDFSLTNTVTRYRFLKATKSIFCSSKN